MEIITYFIFLGSKITADSDYSNEIKMMAPLKESYEKAGQHIIKDRHHFADKSPYNQTMVSLVVLHGYESWTLKRAEH